MLREQAQKINSNKRDFSRDVDIRDDLDVYQSLNTINYYYKSLKMFFELKGLRG
jgi:hypothetical protein